MRLRTRFRISLAVSIGAVLVLALLLGWSLRESRRASNTEDMATLLQRQILERGIVRDEYLVYREPRAREQWDAKSAQIRAILERAADSFQDADERQALSEMTAIVDRSVALFHDLVRVGEEGAPRKSSAPAAAFQERVASKLLLISHDLYGHGKRLTESASKRSQSAQRRALLLVLVMITSVLGITFVNALMTGRLLEKGILRLRDGAKRVAAGDFGHRTGIAGNDELAELAREFDGMTARLQQTLASLEREVTERRHAQDQVTKLNEELSRYVVKLESSNRELEAFSYSVSHDLRAPLRSIAGFSQAVLEDYGPRLDATGREYLEMACQSSRDMGQLIDDLLSLSRVTRVEMAHERVDLTVIARSIANELIQAEPGRAVEFEIAPDLAAAGDPTLLKIVIDNLLRNAWKFTSRHPTARIAFGRAQSNGRDAFYVSDDGVGFDMAYADKLLHPFQRLHGAHEFPGTGIGLATVNRIVRRHGGEVWTHGEVEKGATIYFTLSMCGGANAGEDHPARRGQPERRAADGASLQAEQRRE